MLYVSTRSTGDFYTAFRALNEVHTPDGGCFVPNRLPVFTESELAKTGEQPPGEIIAKILNLFFGERISCWDVECAIGRMPIKSVSPVHSLKFCEAWRNPGGSMDYLLSHLYGALTGKSQAVPIGWSCIAIKISLLFGLFAAAHSELRRGFDIAVAYNDLSDITAVFYAREMGLPINMTVCACNTKQPIWDLINRGTCTRATSPIYWEPFLFAGLGRSAVMQLHDTDLHNTPFQIDAEQLISLRNRLFVAVVSQERVGNTIYNVSQSHQYPLEQFTALAYSGLQDYRSRSGLNQITVILAKHRPEHPKE